MQQYEEIQGTEQLDASRPKILANDKTARSHHEGTTFPTQNLLEGMTCYRSDEKKLYQLIDVSLQTWKLVADLNKTALHQEDADSLYASISHNHDSDYAALNHTHSLVTTSADGFMRATDKTKLNGIATGAQVNQAAVRTVRVNGVVDIIANVAEDMVRLQQGNGVELVASGDQVTIRTRNGFNSYGVRTVGTGTPSGGSDGDIHYQV